MVDTRVKCASSWRARSACISARFRSVTSVRDTTAPPSGRLSGTTDIATQSCPAGVMDEYSKANPVRDRSARPRCRPAPRPHRARPGGGRAARVEVVRVLTMPGHRRSGMASEPRPCLVHGDDAPLAIQDGDPAVQRREDRRLHQLARPQRILALLARQGIGEHLGDERDPESSSRLQARARAVVIRARPPSTRSPVESGSTSMERMPLRRTDSRSAIASSGMSSGLATTTGSSPIGAP